MILPTLWIILNRQRPAVITTRPHARSEAPFYYFRMEDQVPETHLPRLIEKHISFAFVRERLKASYSDTGRPSIDPELLLRILLIGYSAILRRCAFAVKPRNPAHSRYLLHNTPNRNPKTWRVYPVQLVTLKYREKKSRT